MSRAPDSAGMSFVGCDNSWKTGLLPGFRWPRNNLPAFRPTAAAAVWTLQAQWPVATRPADNLDLAAGENLATRAAEAFLAKALPSASAVEPLEHAQMFRCGKLDGRECVHD